MSSQQVVKFLVLRQNQTVSYHTPIILIGGINRGKIIVTMTILIEISKKGTKKYKIINMNDKKIYLMQVLMKQTDTIKTNPSVCKWLTRKCLVGENG
jgi:uncharacterized membrane protein (DUF441 family)